MLSNKLFKNLIINIISYGITIAVSFWLTPFLIRNIGKEMYSFYGISNNFVDYITIISIALNSMASKYIAVEYTKGNLKKARAYFTSIFFSNVILCVFLVPVLSTIVLFINRILSVPSERLYEVQLLFGFVFVSMIVRYISSVFGSVLFTTNRMDIKAYIDIIKVLLRIALYIILFRVFKPSVFYLGIVLLVIELFNSIINIYFKDKMLAEIVIKKEYLDLKLIYFTLKIGIWNSINQLGDLLLSSSDLLICNMALGVSAGGDISITKTLINLLSGAITAVNAVFMPKITNTYAKGNKGELCLEVQLSQRILSSMIIPLVIVLIVFSKDFYNLWVPGNDIKLLSILSTIDMARMIVISIMWPVTNLNIVLDKVKIPSILVIAMGIANIFSMLFFIKFLNYGILVIPMTTLVLTILYYGIFVPLYSSSILNISSKTFYKYIPESVVKIIIVFIFSNFIKQFFIVDSWFDFILYGGIIGFFSLLICFCWFIFNLLRKKNF